MARHAHARKIDPYEYDERENKREVKEDISKEQITTLDSKEDFSRAQQEPKESLWHFAGNSSLSSYTPDSEKEGASGGDKMVSAVDRAILIPTEKALIAAAIWGKTRLQHIRSRLSSADKSGNEK